MRITLVSLVIFLGIIQGIYFSVTIFAIKSGTRTANRIFALMMAFLAIGLIGTFLFETNLYIYFPYLTIFPTHLQLFIWPLFYLYFKAATAAQPRLRWKDIWHWLPFAVTFLYFLPFYLQTEDYKLQYIFRLLYGRLTHLETIEYDALLMMIQLSMLGYLSVIRRRLNADQAKINQSLSTIERINLSWLNFCTNTLLAVSCFMAGALLLNLFGLPVTLFHNICAVLTAIAIYSIGYRGMLQSEIFYADMANAPPKVKKAPLPPKEGHKQLQMLYKIMAEEKPFRDPGLTLGMLADKLSISRSLLSQIINDDIGMNFFDFVNIYRIREVQRYLLDPAKSHLKITALAAEAGFQSKTSFNRIFKLWLHMTPSQFREKYQNAAPEGLPGDELFPVKPGTLSTPP